MIPLRKLAFLGAAAGLSLLAACKQGDAPAADQSAAAVLAPDAPQGLAGSHARLVLPVIAGRPGAAYFSLANNTNETVTLAGVHIAGAGKAEMHRTRGGSMEPVETVDIAPGATVDFAPGGYHVMVFDLSKATTAGATGELTVTLSNGDKLSMPLAVETMAGDAGMGAHDMAGMHDH